MRGIIGLDQACCGLGSDPCWIGPVKYLVKIMRSKIDIYWPVTLSPTYSAGVRLPYSSQVLGDLVLVLPHLFSMLPMNLTLGTPILPNILCMVVHHASACVFRLQ